MNELTVKSDYTPEQMRLITDVVAKGATKDELQLFLYRCKNLGLDPLKPGQIYFVKYGSSPGTIVVGIDGFRARADRTGKLAGIKRGVTRSDAGAVIGAWAEVYRTDWKEPAREEVPLKEYDTGRAMWAKMPETMIKKVAEAAALRMAFPDELGGVYTNEEMDQAAAKPGQIVMTQPGPEDGTLSTQYYIPFGKWKGRTIDQVYRDHGTQELSGYLDYLEMMAKKENKPIRPEVQDFIERVEDHIGSMENDNSWQDQNQKPAAQTGPSVPTQEKPPFGAKPVTATVVASPALAGAGLLPSGITKEGKIVNQSEIDRERGYLK